MHLKFWKNLLLDNPVVDLVDILVVAFIVYQCFLLIEGTRGQVLFNGIIVFLLLKVVSGPLGLNEINWILESFLPAGLLAMVIIFQAELRRGLERLGRGFYFKSFSGMYELTFEKDVSELMSALISMKESRSGALLVFEANVGLKEHYENVPLLNSNISKELIQTVFFKDTPLHDGAMIIKGERVLCASVYLPLSQNPDIDKKLGTRHRAAIGMSEVSDALIIVVSEERQTLSFALNGKLHVDVPEKDIEGALINYYLQVQWQLDDKVDKDEYL
ncbi:diadenylate cyclase CdaA [Candidatus Riflebacteria bacterium]